MRKKKGKYKTKKYHQILKSRKNKKHQKYNKKHFKYIKHTKHSKYSKRTKRAKYIKRTKHIKRNKCLKYPFKYNNFVVTTQKEEQYYPFDNNFCIKNFNKNDIDDDLTSEQTEQSDNNSCDSSDIDGEKFEKNEGLYDENDQLVGTPQKVKKELNMLALRVQKHPEDNNSFNKIHYYIHKYLLGLVFKKYCFVKGYDENDMYQESLIALFKKAIPKFNPHKGMSFLNFAKMCINRHLITILHASKHKKKNIPINTAISLDQVPLNQSSNSNTLPLSNIIADSHKKTAPYKNLSNKETFHNILMEIKSRLSKFEIIVLEEYLHEKSYEEIAQSVSLRLNKKYNSKSIDNALLRIRKKSQMFYKEYYQNIFNNFY